MKLINKLKSCSGKTLVAIVLLFLSFSLITGSMVAYFYSLVSEDSSLVTGNIRLKKTPLLIEEDPNGIDDDLVVGNSLRWFPGDVATIEWSIENLGSKSAITRNILYLAWDSDVDLHEKNVIYLYPANMSDVDIRNDIKNNSAALQIPMGDDTSNISIDSKNRLGFVFPFLGDILDGVGSNAEVGYQMERNTTAPFFLSDDGSTFKDVIRFKVAFSYNASMDYQDAVIHIGVRTDAIQAKHNTVTSATDAIWGGTGSMLGFDAALTLQGTDTVYVERFSKYNEMGYVAYDIDGTDITSNVVVDAVVHTDTLGTYSAVYKV